MAANYQSNPLVDEIAEWLVDQSLQNPNIVEMFEGLCNRIFAIGIPLSRAMLSYETLHPLFDSESVIWKRGDKVRFEQYTFDEDTAAWEKSPLFYMLESKTEILRRRLSGPNALLDFEVLHEFAEAGLTDYLAMTTGISIPSGGAYLNQTNEIIVSWSSDRDAGFSAEDIGTLTRLQRRYAVAAKTVIQSSIATNLTEAYLGKRPGKLVLNGNIRRGDGETIRAVVWYSDIRGSTLLADRLPMADYLDLLNDYFECAAGAALAAGGEVLDFVGDGVLAIFPVEDESDIHASARAATKAVKDAIDRAEKINSERRKKNETTLEFGIGLSLGDVMFGNIGVPERLTFSVIGPTVNQVARIEKLTRKLQARALATPSVAQACRESWEAAGTHALEGVVDPVELYSWAS